MGISAKLCGNLPALCGLRKTVATKERITALTLEAVMQRCKSAAGAKSTVENVTGLVRFFLDLHSDENATLTGDSPFELISDYLEQAASRGGTVPKTTRHSLTHWAAALQLDWPLGRALIRSASTIEANTAPKQAPAMAIETF